jgi:hypothetical protein
MIRRLSRLAGHRLRGKKLNIWSEQTTRAAIRWRVADGRPLFLLFSAENYQRPTAPLTQEFSSFGGIATEKTAGRQQMSPDRRPIL